MSLGFQAIRAILFLTLGSAIAMAPSTSPTRSAEIRVTRGPTFQLAATVAADPPTSGTYEMHVLKVGPAGRTDTRQSGAFDAAGPRHRVLSSQSVAVAEGDEIRATLTVTWADGQIERDSFEETVQTSPAR